MSDRAPVIAARLPVYGPPPNNTLITWRTPILPLGSPGISVPPGPHVDWTTDLHIHGWDVDRADELRSQTHVLVSGFLHGVGMGSDDSFWFAVDEVSGAVDDEGYVTLQMSWSIASDGPWAAMDVALFGWVLCTEPRPSQPQPRFVSLPRALERSLAPIRGT
jgi:hypothetical protein